MAIDFQYEKIEKMILEEGFDVNRTDKDGSTPLLHFTRFYYLYNHVEHIKIIKLLLQRGANPNIKSKYVVDCGEGNSEKDAYPIDFAAKVKSPKLTLLLIKYGAVINNTNTLVGIMSFYYLVNNNRELSPAKKDKYVNGWKNIIDVTLNGHVELNPKSGFTPLFIACNYADYDMIKLLLEKGANPTHCKYYYHSYGYQIVTKSIDMEKIIRMLDILMEYGMSINKKSFNACIIRRALTWNEKTLNKNPKYNEDMVNFLISRGANINSIELTYANTLTALDKAITFALYKSNTVHLSLVEFLLEKGADPNIINGSGSTLNRILSYLEDCGIDDINSNNLYGIISLLIKYGLDINAKDIHNRNVLNNIIYMPDFYDSIELLINNGIEIIDKNNMLESYICNILDIQGALDECYDPGYCLMRGSERSTCVDNIKKIIRLLLHSGATINRFELINTINNKHTNDNTVFDVVLKNEILKLLHDVQPVVSLRRLCLNVLPRRIIGMPEPFFYWPDDCFITQ